jgi:hypothetical protein
MVLMNYAFAVRLVETVQYQSTHSDSHNRTQSHKLTDNNIYTTEMQLQAAT